MEEVVKINLGSGNNHLEGYINVDNGIMFPDAKIDNLCDIADFTIAPNSVDEILLSHVVMYLRPEKLQPLLKKWYNFLKPNGRLIIETADFKKLAKIVASNDSDSIIHSHGMINIFGKEGEPQHTWGWIRHFLTVELYRAGFSNLKVGKGIKKPERDFRIICTK